MRFPFLVVMAVVMAAAAIVASGSAIHICADEVMTVVNLIGAHFHFPPLVIPGVGGKHASKPHCSCHPHDR